MAADWAGYVAEVSDGMRWKAKLAMRWKCFVGVVSYLIKSRIDVSTTLYRDEVHNQYERFREDMKLVQSVVLFARSAKPEALWIELELALTALASFLNFV